MSKKQGAKNIQPAAAVRETKRHLLAFAVLSVSVFVAYSNSINGTWAMDDIVANKPVGITDIRDIVGFRKIAYLTFLLNQHIAPFSPSNFRLFNILLHIFNASLVYLLSYKTVSLFFSRQEDAAGKKAPAGDKAGMSFASKDKAFYAALLAGVMFALHPININAVAYIVQRMTSLAAFFVLLSLLCYIYASGTGGLKAFLLYIFSVVFLIAGIFSKENAVVAVPLILLYEYVFLSGFNLGRFTAKMGIAGCIAFFGIGVTSYFLGFYNTFFEIAGLFLHPNQYPAVKAWMAVDVYWTPLQHILTEFRVVSRYIFLIFVPIPQFLVFDLWGLEVSKNLFEPATTIFSMLLVLSLFIFSLWKLKRFPLLCFGILWYLLSVSLESFLALGSDLYFEHRNYLPVSGLLTGIIGQISVSLNDKFSGRTFRTAAVILCVLLGSLTFARNFVWRDSITLWGDALKKNPLNIRAMISMGNAYLMLSEMDNAERYYGDAVKLSAKGKRLRFLNDSMYSLGMTYLSENKLHLAKDLIDSFDYIIKSYRSKILKGYYKALNNDLEGALEEYNSVADKTEGIDSVVVLTLMGDAYRGKGILDAAIRKYGEAIALDEGFSAAYYGLGMSYLGKRNISLASEYIDKALYLDPGNVLALSDKADLLLITKTKPEVALTYAQRAVSKSPPFYQPYLTIANILIVAGRADEAEAYYRKALERGAMDYLIPFGKARAYYLKGDEQKAGYYLAELRRRTDLPKKIKDSIR